MKTSFHSLLVLAGGLLATTGAYAHISGPPSPSIANASQELTFGVGHGCTGADTFRVKIDIPAGVTSVRPVNGDLGKATVEKDGAGVVTAVTWEKAVADALADDTHYYRITLRAKLPNAPFTRLAFPVHQTCRAASGTLTTVDWVAPPGTVTPDGGVAPEPAPVVVVMPARVPGWNKFTVPVDVLDLGVFLKDAVIVWKGSAAYSANPGTAAQIKAEAGVTELKELRAGDEISVKY